MDPKEQLRLAMDGAAQPYVIARRRARRACDPLEHRRQCAVLWRSDPWTRISTPAWVFFRQANFRRYLMPGVREHLAVRDAERHARWETEMMESERRWKLAKALKKAQPLPLFDGAAQPTTSAKE